MTGAETWNKINRELAIFEADARQLAAAGNAAALATRKGELAEWARAALEGLYHSVCDLTLEQYNGAIALIGARLQALGYTSLPPWWGELTPGQYYERRQSLGCADASLTNTPGASTTPAGITVSSDIVIAAVIVGGIAGLAAFALLIRKLK